MVTYQPARGMRDLVGESAVLQDLVESKFRAVYTRYGYYPLYTPAVESFELFKVKGAAGEAIKEEIYYFQDKSERELALRFEFTASLARVVASNQLKLPFKRFQIGEVYRYDRPQAKRYRAFTQADVDIVGVSGLTAELEIMSVIRDCFKELNLAPRIIFNSRKLLEEILGKYAKGKEVLAMRILDKMDKLDKKEIAALLTEQGIDARVVELIEKNSLTEIKNVLGETTPGILEITEFEKLCKETGLTFVVFDARLARGFEYYTGIVFEVKLDNGPSVGGGGRFDKLIALYGGAPTPAVGVGLGVSRIVDYLLENKFPTPRAGIFLFGLGVTQKELFTFAEQLRAAGTAVEIDLVGKNVSKNIEYAEKKGYSFVGILGENEFKKGEFILKNIKEGKQEIMKLTDVAKITQQVMQ